MLIEIQKLKLFSIYFILSLLAMYFVFSSAVHIPFYHHDIYKYSWGGIYNSCRSDQGFGYLHRLGRPVSAFLDCYNYKLGNSLSSISYIRIQCMLLIAFAMSVFALRLHSAKLLFWPAFFISGAIFLLPVIQTTIIMASITLIFAILMAFLAYYFISKSRLFVKRTWRSCSLQDTLYFLSGIICLLISLLTYPSLSSCFLLPVFVLLLFQPLSSWLEIKRIFLRDIIIFLLCCSLYFITARMLQTHFSAVPANYQFKLTFHFISRIIFLYKHFPSLWMINATFLQVVLINLMIMSGFVIGLKNFFRSDFYKHPENQPIRVFLQVISAAVVLLLLGSLTLLVMPSQDVPISRVIFVFQAMIILIIGWSIAQISSLFHWQKNYEEVILAGLLFLVGALVANYNITKSALNDNIELNFVTAMLAKHMYSPHLKLKRIHFIAPAVVNFNGLPRGDDIFNDNSTRYAGDIVNIANTALLQIAKKNAFILHDCIFPESKQQLNDETHCMRLAPKNSIVVTYGLSKQAVYKITEETLVIDMNLLNWAHQY